MPETSQTLPSVDVRDQRFTDISTQAAERRLAPSFRTQLAALREGFARRGLSSSGLQAQAEIGLRQDALARLAAASNQASQTRFGAINRAREAELQREFQDSQFQAALDFQDEQDREAARRASENQFSNLLSTGGQAVGSIVGMFFGAGDAGGALGGSVGGAVGGAADSQT